MLPDLVFITQFPKSRLNLKSQLTVFMFYLNISVCLWRESSSFFWSMDEEFSRLVLVELSSVLDVHTGFLFSIAYLICYQWQQSDTVKFKCLLLTDLKEEKFSESCVRVLLPDSDEPQHFPGLKFFCLPAVVVTAGLQAAASDLELWKKKRSMNVTNEMSSKREEGLWAQSLTSDLMLWLVSSNQL